MSKLKNNIILMNAFCIFIELFTEMLLLQTNITPNQLYKIKHIHPIILCLNMLFLFAAHTYF